MTDPEYPPAEHLMFWWVCLRKQSYDTKAEAKAVSSQYINGGEAYHCRYADHWHNGKTRGPNSTHGPYTLRKQWRKRIKKPTPEALAAAYEAVTSKEEA